MLAAGSLALVFAATGCDGSGEPSSKLNVEDESATDAGQVETGNATEQSRLADEGRPPGAETERAIGPLTGTVRSLMHVGFQGLPSDSDRGPWQRPVEGSACVGPDTSPYREGAEVTVTSGDGAVIGVGRLADGQIQTDVLASPAEWDRRESLIDAIYNLRNSTTRDPLKQATWNLERAELRLEDYDRRSAGEPPPPFEGYEFVPVYCGLAFTIDIADSDFYRVTVAGGETFTFARTELEADAWHLELVAQ